MFLRRHERSCNRLGPHNKETQLTGRDLGRACALAEAGITVWRPAADLSANVR
jgi:hypothetical protein